jgi:hypothetical protein
MVERLNFDEWGSYFGTGFFQPAFFLPFKDEKLAQCLSAHVPYRFTNLDKGSFLDYFQQKKYISVSRFQEPIALKAAFDLAWVAGAETSEKPPAALSPAILESQPLQLVTRLVQRHASHMPEISFNADIQVNELYPYDARILQLQSLTNSALFYPISPLNGFMNLFDLLRNDLHAHAIPVYPFSLEGKLDEQLSSAELGAQINLLKNVYENDIEMFESSFVRTDTLPLPSVFIDSWYVLELHVGKAIYPVAISPEILSVNTKEMFYELNGEPEKKYSFWIPLNASVRKTLALQQLMNLQPKPAESIYSWLMSGNYQGEILSARPIEKTEAVKLAIFLN